MLLILCAIFWCIFGLYFIYISYNYADYAKDDLLGDYVGSIVLVITAGVAVFLTWLELRQHKREAKEDRRQAAVITKTTSKHKATLDMISKTEFDEGFVNAKIAFQKYSNKKNRELEKLIGRVQHCIRNDNSQGFNEGEFKDLINIRSFFNSFELAALAIHKDILEEEIFREWQATSFILVWNRSAKSIGFMRRASDNNKVYEHWERLVRVWGQRPEYNIDVKKAECSPEEYEEFCNLKYSTRNKKEPKDDNKK